MPLFNEILVPGGNFDDDIHRAVGNTLAAQSRLQRNVRRFIKLVEFVVGRFVTRFETLLDFDVAGRAGAYTTADVLQANIRTHSDVQDAARLACRAVRHFRRVDVNHDRGVVAKDRDLVRLLRKFEVRVFDVWIGSTQCSQSP
jgi:hypothetical protein